MSSSEPHNKGKSSSISSLKGCIYPAHCPAVPVVPAFTLRTTAVPNDSKEVWNGHKNMYALHDIPQGTRIVNESPILFLTIGDVKGASYKRLADMIFNDVMGMCEEKQQFVWGLKVAAVWEMHKLVEELDPLIDELKRLKELPNNKLTPTINKRVAFLSTHLDDACTKWRLAARVLPSLTSICYDLTKQQINELENDQAVKGLFQTISYIQHSCMPNCQLAWNERTMRMTVHTIKPVPAGEELTYNYFGYLTFHRDYHTRAKIMRHHPMLWCRCPACNSLDMQTLVMQSHIRNIIHELAKDPIMADVADRFSPLPVLECAERQVLKVLDLLSEAGCDDMAKMIWLDVLATNIYPKIPGKHLISYKYAKLAADLAEKCVGADNSWMHKYYWKAQIRKTFGEDEVRRKLEVLKK